MIDDRVFFASASTGLDPARVTIVTPAAAEPVTVAELREFLRVDSTTREARVLELFIKGARAFFERSTGLILITQTLRATYDRVPRRSGATVRELELPVAPVQSVASVGYLDSAGVAQVFSSGSYTVAAAATRPARPGRVVLTPSADWPSAGDYAGAFYVNFVAGYGTAASDVPADIRTAVLMLAAYWYEQRLPVNVGNIVNEMPLHFQSLIELHRVHAIA
jgi:uncharacterized phiE125 gp8 family phage protein